MTRPSPLERLRTCRTTPSLPLALLATSSRRSVAPAISSVLSHVCVTFVELVTHFQSAHHVVVAPWLQRSFATACRSQLHVVSRRAAGRSSGDCRFLWLPNLVLTCAFRRVDPSLTWCSNPGLWIREFRSPSSCLRDATPVQLRFPSGWRSWLGTPSCVVVRSPSTPCKPDVAPNSDTIFVDADASAVLHVLGFRRCGPAFTSGFTMGMYLFGAAGLGSTATRPSCKAPGISECSKQHNTVPAFPLVSSPYAAARRHCCVNAHDVFSRPRVETEPATVQPVHSEFLLWPRSLVWLEEYLFTERGMERRQCSSCMSYKPFQD